MSDAEVHGFALHERERLDAVAGSLRARLAAVEAELATAEAFLAEYSRYQALIEKPFGDHGCAESPEPPRTSYLFAPTPVVEGPGAGLPACTMESERTGGLPVEAFLVLPDMGGARRISVPPAPLLIGSAEHCDVVFPAELGVAPEHAIVWLAGDEVMLRVPDPETEVLVGEQSMSFAGLQDGDLIRLGQVLLRIAVLAARPAPLFRSESMADMPQMLDPEPAAEPRPAMRVLHALPA